MKSSREPMNPRRRISPNRSPMHVALLFLLSATAVAWSDPLRAGIGLADITPPIPYRMSGYFSERLSTATKDPLFAKAIVFRQDGAACAVVFCDIIGMSPQVTKAARERASQATGIPAANIVIAATHSHTGPLYFGALRAHFHDRAIQQVGRDPYETVDYPALLVERLVDSIAQADARLQPVEIKSGYADERRLSFNRRFHMRDGSVRFNPGQQNPDIVRVAGPTDPQVGTVTLARPGTPKPFAVLVSFALHLDTVGGTEYSADYPKYLQDGLRTEFGPDFSCLFGTGTCGDINHIDVSTKGRRGAQEIGSMLAATVSEKINSGTLATAEGSLAVRTGQVVVPLQEYSPAEIDEARRHMDLIGTRELAFLDQVKAFKIMALQLREGKTMPIEVQALRLNDETAIVCLPGEVFVELGIAIKAASPFRHTLLVELANDAPGYIPTRKAFAEGSYETVNSRVAAGGGEAMVELASRLLSELGPPR